MGPVLAISLYVGLVTVFKERHFGKRRMEEVEIYSRNTIPVPRKLSRRLPRILYQRWKASSDSSAVGREVVFHEQSATLYVREGMCKGRELS